MRGSEVSSFKDVVYVANAVLVYNEHYQKYFFFLRLHLYRMVGISPSHVISHSSSYLRCQNQRELFSLLMMILCSHIIHRGRTILSMLLSFFTSYDSCMIFIRGGRHNKLKTRDHEKKNERNSTTSSRKITYSEQIKSERVKKGFNSFHFLRFSSESFSL